MNVITVKAQEKDAAGYLGKLEATLDIVILLLGLIVEVERRLAAVLHQRVGRQSLQEGRNGS
jgi:NADH:ubiquinone oxidoreductase subunit H